MEIEERVGEDVRMAFTQPPQLLMLRENPNPYLFIVSGRYPWRYFIVWSVAGQTGWVAGYVLLGDAFSDRARAMSELLGAPIWLAVGLIFVFLGRKLPRYRASLTKEHHVLQE